MNNIDFISLYHSYINKYYKNIKLHSIQQVDNLGKKNILHEYFDSPFLSNELRIDLEEKISRVNIFKYTYIVKLPQGYVSFHFISDKNLKSINNLKKYYFFVIFLQINSGKNYLYLDNVYINIITLDVPKIYTNSICINDINSASTIITFPKLGGQIYLWRTDELEKVLIHETLHSIFYDWDIINQKLNDDLLLIEKKISTNGKKLNINEAYTELCATFIMCLFELGKNLNKIESKKKLKIILKRVLEHSLKTSGKLFSKYKIKDSSQCTNVDKLEGCSYHQSASAYSYIIMKTALLWTLMKKCKLRDRKQTDKIQCIEDFLSIGFTGVIGYSYQKIIIKILKDKSFNREVTKRLKNKGKLGNMYFTIFN